MNADRIARNISNTATEAESSLITLVREATEALESLRSGDRIGASISGDVYFLGTAAQAASRLVKLQAQIDLAVMADMSPAAVEAAATNFDY